MKNQNLVKKFTKKDMSVIMTRAHKFLAEIPMDSRTEETWSNCMKKSWHIAKNGENNIRFEDVYNNYYKQIFYYINGKVKDSDLAEDLTQNTFEKVFKKFDNYNVYKAKLNTWIYSIALNCVIDHIRSKANKNKLQNISVNQYTDEDNKEFLQLPDNSTNDNTIENNELLDKLSMAFENLKPNYRQIAEMYFIQELKYNEIAETLNIPMGTVKGMINRCRTKLQSQLVTEKV